jgi:hypothetical protein
MSLNFVKANNSADVEAIYDYNIDAFSDTPDFKWTLEAIQSEVKKGWELYGVMLEKEVIAAVFLKVEDKSLFSKNTSVKMMYQGSGYSHKIKEFIEAQARSTKVDRIFHFCRIDNFRSYSLNESHGYKKTGNKHPEDPYLVEWVKEL